MFVRVLRSVIIFWAADLAGFSNAADDSVSVSLADFAAAALIARDNFRVAEYYAAGERYPTHTHFDELDWENGFSEVWLYALRSARVALQGVDVLKSSVLAVSRV